ncbi:hypothetical protein [Actinoallomurus sp. NPDC052274]|uniref:hypothetical protein n=1 Tax=Actinoallomurus sp. NPDC052274 TaxID=3155420 RepID=UPI00344227E7
MADPAGGRLDPKQWPGMDANADELKISVDDAKKILKALQDDLNRYDTTYGTPDDIRGRGSIKDARIYAGGMDDRSGYPAGRTLATYLQNANTNIPTHYEQFLQAYDRVIQAFGEMTGVYQKTEDKNSENSLSANDYHPAQSQGNTTYYGGQQPNT